MVWLVLWSCIRLVKIVTKPFVVEFVAGEVGLNRAGFANNFGGAIPILDLKRRLMLGEVLIRLWGSSLKQCDLQARFRQPLARPASGSARAHHDHIERCWFSHGPLLVPTGSV